MSSKAPLSGEKPANVPAAPPPRRWDVPMKAGAWGMNQWSPHRKRMNGKMSPPYANENTR